MSTIDCACLIHGSAYDWCYVQNLHRMLRQHWHNDVTLHVFTEAHRRVPEPFVRHDLQDWPGASGPRRAWWNKLQIFDPRHWTGRVLYLDLDVVILGDLNWLRDLEAASFWAIRDYRRLWRPAWRGINSSMMLWDARSFGWIWDTVRGSNIDDIMRDDPGDQDWLTKILPQTQVSFFPEHRIRSWRWECLDGGMDMRTRQYKQPGAGAVIPDGTDVVVFHGRPKPHQIPMPWVQQHWAGHT